MRFDQLETRECLAAPVLSGLAATPLPGHLLQISGRVADENPAGVRVNFSGAATGTVMANADGDFVWATTCASLGTVSAIALDQQGLNSSPASATASTSAPVLTMSLTHGAGRTVTISGQVTDLDPGGRTVTISGVLSGSVLTSSSGTYSLTGEASGIGSVQGSTVNLWGLTSNNPDLWVSSPAPVITEFTASEGANDMWTFSGCVTDDSLAGMTIHLGGLPSLQNQTVQVQADGTFAITIQLDVGEQGTATAQAIDAWGIESNLAMAIVRQ